MVFPRIFIALAGVLVSAAPLLLACGGTAVVDGGAGGAGAAASGVGAGTSSASGGAGSSGPSVGASSTSTGGQNDCQKLEIEMLAAFDEATMCDPFVDVEQCTGMTLAKSYCDCAVTANDFLPEVAALSLELGNKWAASGCEYNFCESGCYPPDAPWYCDPNTFRCTPAYE